MVAVALTFVVILVVAAPVIVFNRRGVARRRRRRMHALPFLFIPSGSSASHPPPEPLWRIPRAASAAAEGPIRPEPGIADMPPRTEPEIGGLPGDELPRVAWGVPAAPTPSGSSGRTARRYKPLSRED